MYNHTNPIFITHTQKEKTIVHAPGCNMLANVKEHFSKINITYILLLALILRIAWLFYAHPVPVSDFGEYKQLASDLITYHQFGFPSPTAYRLPGYPIFLAIFMQVSSSNIWLGFVNVLLSVILVYFIFILANQLAAKPKVALSAGFIAAVYPIYIFFSPILASEHLFTVLLYAGLILLLSEFHGKKLYIMRGIAGFFFGAAMITRGEAIYYLPIIALLGVFPNRASAEDRVKNSLSTRVLSLLLLFFVWLISITPWYIRNQAVIGPGSGLGTSGGIMFYYGHHDESQEWKDLLKVENLGSGEIYRSSNAFQKGLNYLFQAPVGEQIRDKFIETLRLYAPNGYPVIWSVTLPPTNDGTPRENYLLLKDVFILLTIAGYLIVGTLALLSLFFYKQYPLRLWITSLGFALLNMIGYAILFAATSRYRFTIEGFLCILAAISIYQFEGIFKQLKESRETKFKLTS
jgi:4-amino-4-deoxy-L-arabinose transferase-like glycosyltransferase